MVQQTSSHQSLFCPLIKQLLVRENDVLHRIVNGHYYTTIFITDSDDYFRQDLVLTFETTSTSMDVVIPLINDDVMEGEETFTLSLLLLDGAEGVRLGSSSTTTVNITDDARP